MKKINLFLALIALVILPLLVMAPKVSANKAALMGGNFMTGFNNTIQSGTWTDPIEAAPENVVEFRIQVRNEGDEQMDNVQVWAVLPSASSTELITTGGIRTNNAVGANAEVGDTIKVNVTGGFPVGLRLLAGHQRIFGVTDLHNCPNGCDIADTLTTGGLNIGNVPAGQEIQLGFKAFLTQAVTPSPSPSPSPSPTPTPSVTPPAGPPGPPGPAGPPGASATACTNNSCNATATITNPAPAQVLGVKTLPKTGIPVQALLGFSAVPVGLLLKKFTQGSKVESDPDFIWNDRQFKLD